MTKEALDLLILSLEKRRDNHLKYGAELQQALDILKSNKKEPEWHNPYGLALPNHSGYRFLVKGERVQTGDEFWSKCHAHCPDKGHWIKCVYATSQLRSLTYRTKRPLP